MDIYAMSIDRDMESSIDKVKDHWHLHHEHYAKQLCAIVEIYHEVTMKNRDNNERKDEFEKNNLDDPTSKFIHSIEIDLTIEYNITEMLKMWSCKNQSSCNNNFTIIDYIVEI